MNNRLRRAGLCCLALGISACTSTPQNTNNQIDDQSAPNSFSFAVVGDIPYNDDQKKTLYNEITPELKKFPFVVHVGDTKAGGGAPCTDALDEEHLNWMKSVGVPVFYTPGDNEWTDCDRPSNAPVTRELLRLDKLRAKFFSPATITAPASWQAVWQAGMPENASWIYENVRFATLHMVGSNNGRAGLEACTSANSDDCDTPAAIAAAVAMRDRHNVAWVASVFAKARTEGAGAMVIATQADVTDVDDGGVDCSALGQIDCDGFKEIRQLIASEAATFGKPVLFVHGDTSPYCWDRNFGGAEAQNLWRLNGAGDYKVIDAVNVVVSPGGQVPFKAEGVVSQQKPDENGCR